MCDIASVLNISVSSSQILMQNANVSNIFEIFIMFIKIFMVMLLTRVHLLPVCPQTTLLLYSTDGHVHVLFGEHHVGVIIVSHHYWH